MNIQKDYEEFLRLLNAHEVRYCIIGSFALAYHARPRYTKDLDILLDPTPENAERVICVLQEFGFDNTGLTPEDFVSRSQVIQIGFEPVRIDLISEISGCTFHEVWDNRILARYGDTEVYFIGKQQLIQNKRASGRKQDLADLEYLET